MVDGPPKLNFGTLDAGVPLLAAPDVDAVFPNRLPPVPPVPPNKPPDGAADDVNRLPEVCPLVLGKLKAMMLNCMRKDD